MSPVTCGAGPDARCAACGADRLVLHLKVAGEPGAEGLIPSTDRFGTALSDIVRCPACGHMQLDVLPDPATLAVGYEAAASTDYLEEERGQRATARTALDRVERYVPPGRLLDVGCWAGFLLLEARERGWQPTGIEPSTFASGFARERLGLDVRTTDVFAAELEPHAFDAIVMADVLEHFPNPGALLDRVAALTADDGVIQLALPDAGSLIARALGRRWWSVIPTHIHYFTRASLAILLARHGWKLLELDTAPKVFSVSYYLGRTAGYSGALADALQNVAARARLAERLWAPDFRDRMTAIAQRGS